jgi:hypothetical protein
MILSEDVGEGAVLQIGHIEAEREIRSFFFFTGLFNGASQLHSMQHAGWNRKTIINDVLLWMCSEVS